MKRQREIDREEAEALAELKRITPSNEELLKLAERYPPPQEWYDEDFSDLFDDGTISPEALLALDEIYE